MVNNLVKILVAEWNSRVNQLRSLSATRSEIEAYKQRLTALKLPKNNKDEKHTFVNSLFSSGLVLINKKSKIRYTVNKVGSQGASLIKPDGMNIMVSLDDLADKFEVG